MSSQLKAQIREKEEELKAMSEKLALLNNKVFTVNFDDMSDNIQAL